MINYKLRFARIAFGLYSYYALIIFAQVEILSLLIAQVNGERNPSEVYVSFRDAVRRILGMSNGEIQDQDVPQSLEAEVSLD